MIAMNRSEPTAMGVKTVALRSLGSVASFALLIVFVPRTAALLDGGLTWSLALAALFLVGALSCALGRVWSGAAMTLAALALSLVSVGRGAAAGLTAAALGTAAAPLAAPLVAAAVASRRWF